MTKKKKPSRPLRVVLRDYAQQLAIALFLALFIRACIVEAFKIPTSSMEPTLIGREKGGDTYW